MYLEYQTLIRMQELMRDAEQHRLVRAALGERKTRRLALPLVDAIAQVRLALGARRMKPAAGSELALTTMPCDCCCPA